MSLDELFVLSVVSAIVSAVNIRLDISGIYSIGKSRNARDKIRRQYTMWQRMTLLHVKEHSNFFNRKLRVMLVARYVNYSVSAVILGFLILSKGQPEWMSIVQSLLLCKVIIVDAPVLLNFILSTEADMKGGGVIPKYERWLAEKGINFKNKNK